MKKVLCLLLCLLMLLPLLGCQEESGYQRPLTFYYPVKDIGYAPTDICIGGETREGIVFESFTQQLQAYLQGPVSEDLSHPFPKNVRVVHSLLEDHRLYLTLSDELSVLTGLSLTLACCCIAKTTMEWTNATEVHISAASTLLGGEKTLLFTAENMNMLDTVTDPVTD